MASSQSQTTGAPELEKIEAAYTDWDDFNPLEYAERNYGKMLPEDEIIIKKVAQMMETYGIRKGEFDNAADVGAGPNLYPAMLLAPFIKQGGKIDLIEYSRANRNYLKKILIDPQGEYKEHRKGWIEYGKVIEKINGASYGNSFRNVQDKVEIKPGSIYELPVEKYSAVSSFFCGESITDNKAEFQQGLDSLLGSVRPNGVFVVAHMLESKGYDTGAGTNFPAVDLSVEDLRQAYIAAGCQEGDFKIELAVAGEDEAKPREGYHGMAVVIGRKPEKRGPKKSPLELTKLLYGIKDKFRDALNFSQTRNSKDALKENLQKELANAETAAIVDGVNFSYCHMDVLVRDYEAGKKLEFDSFSPYLIDYDVLTGEIDENNLAKSDAIGLEIAKMLRTELPSSRLVCLYDEYNGRLSGSKDRQPTDLEFSDQARANFRSNIEKVLRDKGVLIGSDKEGEEYLFISESEKIKDAEQLVARLENLNGKSYIKRGGQSIKFINPAAENPAYSEIELRAGDGRWRCEALDAASYLKPENLEIAHLVVLPSSHFVKQQDQVWEILRVLGVQPSNYHNIFYDDNLPPEKVAAVIKKEIAKYKHK